MGVIGSLSVKLGLVTVEWDKATSQAKKQARDLQVAFNDLGLGMGKLKAMFNSLGGAAGLSLGGFAAMSHSVMQLAGNLDDLAKTYDVSIAKLLQFQNAIVMAGGKSEDAGKIMSIMFSKISEAQKGNEASIAAFEELGITFEQLRSMSPEQALTRVYEGLASIGNTYDRIKAVKEILGRGGLHKSVEEIAQALGKSTAEFRRQEESMKAWAELGDRLDRTLLNLKLAFADIFKALTGGDFVPSVNQFKSAMVAVTSVLVINGMFRLVAAFRALNVALKSTAALGMAISAAGGIKGVAMAGAGLAAYFGAMEVFDRQDATAAEEDAGTTPEGDEGADKKGERRVIAAGMAKINLAKQMMDIDRRRHEYQLHYLKGSKDELALAESGLKFEEDIAKAAQAKSEAMKAENLSGAQKGLIQQTYLADLNKAETERKQRDALINAGRDIAIAQLERMTEYENQIAAVKGDQARLENERVNMSAAQYDKQREELTLREKLLAIDEKRKELQVQWEGHGKTPEFVEGMAQLANAEATERALSLIRQRGIEAERMRQEDFVTGWDYAFAQYTKDAQNYGQLAQDAFRTFTSNMNSAIDNFVRTGKLSFKDFAKSVIQDIMAMILKFQMMQMIKSSTGIMGFTLPGLLGRASGGEVAANTPYMVGERGPELFVPNNAGSIVPNNRMGGVGSTTNVTNNYINAIDTKSFEERLFGSSNAIWAANQYAGKSLAINRGRA